MESKSVTFFVKSLYASLEIGSFVQFPIGVVWNTWVPPKVSFFAWEATWGKALTLNQLQRRGWSLAYRCFLCQGHEESIDHILLHCGKTKVLWELLFSLFTVYWVMQSTRETLIGWHGNIFMPFLEIFGKREIEDLLRIWSFLPNSWNFCFYVTC